MGIFDVPVVLTGVNRSIKSIYVERVVNASTRRMMLQKKIGSGLDPELFRQMFKDCKAGHAGFRDGRTLLVTVMNPEPKHNQVYREAGALLDWGFKAGATAKPVGTLVPPLSKVKAASASPKPAASAHPKRVDASATSSSSSSHGLWTAAGITLGTALVLAVVVAVVRRRRPLPTTGPGRRRRRKR